MKKAAALIVRLRLPLLALVLICAVLAASMIGKTTINYDLTSYLKDDTDTKRALRIMQDEFESTGNLTVMLEGADEQTAQDWCARIAAALPDCLRVSHDPSAGVRVQDATEYRLLDIIIPAQSEDEALTALDALFKDGDAAYKISGAVRDMRDLRESITREMPVVMLVACLIVLGVLFFMSRSWLEPFIFFIVIFVSILLNMGTNWLFDSISFITFAVAAILQLALAMDYSIMLMNAYDRLRDQGMAPEAAMTEALAGAFMPITSSALTTVAGMISLVFMSFTIGYDIGIVLAKGIIMSMLTVFLLMPGLLIACGPLLRKTAHKQIHLGGRHIPKLASKTRGAVPILLIVLILAGALVQTGNVYTYTMQDTSEDSRFTTELFGEANQAVLLFPAGTTDDAYATQREMLRRVGELQVDGKPVLRDAYAMVTTGAQALAYYDAADVAALMHTNESSVKLFFSILGIKESVRADRLIALASEKASSLGALLPDGATDALAELQAQLSLVEKTFNGRNWARAIILLDIKSDDAQAARVVQDIKQVMASLYGDQYAVAGMLMATRDIADSFRGDMLRVSLITILAVFFIITLSFRSAIIPAVLVCVIQGAIWVNMALSGLLDGTVFFMCYLICMALQMGATIDYGILLTDHYIACRRTLDKREAIRSAMDKSMQTILTSGLALIVAGFTVGAFSSVYYISSIGNMLGRGATISVLLVLLLLPQLLLWLDRWIARDSKTKTPAVPRQDVEA